MFGIDLNCGWKLTSTNFCVTSVINKRGRKSGHKSTAKGKKLKVEKNISTKKINEEGGDHKKANGTTQNPKSMMDVAANYARKGNVRLVANNKRVTITRRPTVQNFPNVPIVG